MAKSASAETVSKSVREKIVIIKPVPVWNNGRQITQIFGPDVFFFPKWIPEGEDRANWTEVHIPGQGMVLDTNKKNSKMLYDVIHNNEEILAHFMPGASQRFRFQDTELEAEEYLKSLDNKASVIAIIQNLKTTGEDDAIFQVGRSLGLQGSVNIILRQLFELCEKPSELVRMSEYFMSPDKQLLDIIYTALTVGNENDKKGLYKTPTGVYKYNQIIIGGSLDDVLLWLKNDENKGAYLELKKLLVKNS